MSFLRLRDTPTGLAIEFVDVPSAITNAGHVHFNQIDIAQIARPCRPAYDPNLDGLRTRREQRRRQGYADDALLVTGSSWENYHRHDSENVSGSVPVVDQLLLRVSSAAQPGARRARAFWSTT